LKDSQGTCHALPAKTQALHSSRQQSHPVTKLDHQLFQIRVFSSTTEAHRGREVVQSRRRFHKKWQTVAPISKQRRCNMGILHNKHRYNIEKCDNEFPCMYRLKQVDRSMTTFLLICFRQSVRNRPVGEQTHSQTCDLNDIGRFCAALQMNNP
jgi:hypothetical protein